MISIIDNKMHIAAKIRKPVLYCDHIPWLLHYCTIKYIVISRDVMYYNTLMKPRRFLTSFKIGIMMIFIRISAAVRPSRTVRPRIDWKVLALYLSLIGVTAFFVGMYVVGTLHTGLHQFYPR